MSGLMLRLVLYAARIKERQHICMRPRLRLQLGFVLRVRLGPVFRTVMSRLCANPTKGVGSESGNDMAMISA